MIEVNDNSESKFENGMIDIQKKCWEYVEDWVKEACEKDDKSFINKVLEITQKQNE